jgi:hypothetical protein
MRRQQPYIAGQANTFEIVAAVLCAVPLAYYGVRAVWAVVKKGSSSPSSKPIADWTAAEVAAWMRSVGVSESAITAFTSNDVDGKILLRIREYHLVEMGVKKLRDRMILQRSIKELRGAAQSSADDEDSRSAPAAVPDGAPRDAAPAQRAGVSLEGVIAKLSSVYDRVSGDEFIGKSHSVQQTIVRESRQDLAAVLNDMQNLPPGERQQVQPLTEQLSEMLSKVQQVLEMPQVQQNSTSTMEAGKKIFTMLEGFKEALQSDEAKGLPTQRKAEIARNVIAQLTTIEELIQQLPPQLREALLSRKNDVLSLATAFGSGRDKPQVKSESPAKKHPQRASVDFLMDRLKGVFEALRSPTLMQKPAAQRFTVLAQLEKDVASIATETEHLPAQQKELVSTIVQNVSSVLSQVISITQREGQLAAAQQEHLQSNDASTNGAPSGTQKAILISAGLRRILDVIRSSEFAQASLDSQLRAVIAMKQEIIKLDSIMEQLPAEQKDILLPTFSRVNDMVHSLMVHAQQAINRNSADGGAQQEEEEEEEGKVGEDEEPNKDGDSGEHPEQGNDTTADDEQDGNQVHQAFQYVMASLKEVLDIIGSEEFDRAPPEAQKETAQALLSHVEKVARIASILPDELLEPVNNFMEPLRTMLSKVANAGDPDTGNDHEASLDEDRDGGDQGGDDLLPSAGLAEVLTGVQRVMKIVSSPAYETAPLARKKSITEELLRHLRSIASSAQELGDEELKQAKVYIDPLMRLLTLTLQSQEG